MDNMDCDYTLKELVDLSINSETSTEKQKEYINLINQELINKNDTNILKVVELLETYLINKDPFIRSKGIFLLSSIIELILENQSKQDKQNKKEVLTNKEVTILIQFYLERLDDQPSVGEIIRGILILLQFDNEKDKEYKSLILEKDLIEIPKQIINSLALQTYQQVVRYNVYLIFLLYLEKYLKITKDNYNSKEENLFISGFINCFEGEKDPRNLMISFKIIKLIIQKLNYKSYIEDLFTVIFCYFPITFKPPPNDIYGITSDHLKIALTECISCTPYFAKFSLPLLIEKLSSNKIETKYDSIITLNSCTLIYDSDDFKPYLNKLWPLLYQEIINNSNNNSNNSNSNNSNEKIILIFLQSIIKLLSLEPIVINKESSLNQFLNLICNSFMDYINEAEFKNSNTIANLLYCISSTTDPSNTFVTTKLLPIFINKIQTNKILPTQRKVLLDFVTILLTTTFTLKTKLEQQTNSSIETDLNKPLEQYKEDIITIYKDSVLYGDFIPFKCSGLKGLASLIICNLILDEQELNEIINIINTSCFETNVDKTIRKSATESLVLIASYQPDIILLHTLPILDNKISQSSSPAPYLDLLIQIFSPPTLILQGLELLLNHSLSSLSSNRSLSIQLINSMTQLMIHLHLKNPTHNRSEMLKSAVYMALVPLLEVVRTQQGEFTVSVGRLAKEMFAQSKEEELVIEIIELSGKNRTIVGYLLNGVDRNIAKKLFALDEYQDILKEILNQERIDEDWKIISDGLILQAGIGIALDENVLVMVKNSQIVREVEEMFLKERKYDDKKVMIYCITIKALMIAKEKEKDMEMFCEILKSLELIEDLEIQKQIVNNVEIIFYRKREKKSRNLDKKLILDIELLSDLENENKVKDYIEDIRSLVEREEIKVKNKGNELLEYMELKDDIEKEIIMVGIDKIIDRFYNNSNENKKNKDNKMNMKLLNMMIKLMDDQMIEKKGLKIIKIMSDLIEYKQEGIIEILNTMLSKMKQENLIEEIDCLLKSLYKNHKEFGVIDRLLIVRSIYKMMNLLNNKGNYYHIFTINQPLFHSILISLSQDKKSIIRIFACHILSKYLILIK